MPSITPSSPSRSLAVVTGATAGIGRVFCERLAARGHDLVLVARDRARLEATAAALADRHGVVATPHPCDLADPAALEALAAWLAGRPRVDVLVNNAGFGTMGALATAPAAGQTAMVRVHCEAPVRLTQAVLPGMLARDAGLVVHVASVAAFMTAPGNATYSATKAFLVMLATGMSTELAGTGVRVQALCPGFTRTEFHERARMAVGEIPRPLWMSAERVVDASLAAADRGGPVVVVPGAGYRAVVAGVRHVPLRLMTWLLTHAPRPRRH